MPLFFIIDDQPMFQSGLCALLNSHFEDTQCIAFDSLEDAVEPWVKQMPDIIILDLSLSGLKGIQAIRFLRHVFQNVPVLVISASEEVNIIQRSMDAGAAMFISKTQAGHDIATVVQNIMNDNEYYTRVRLAQPKEHQFQLKYVENITKRQLEVLKQMRKDKKYKQIAFDLGCSEHTVKVHSRSIFRTLGVNGRDMAVHKAVSLGLFD